MIVDIDLRRVKTIEEMRTLLAGVPLECRALDRASVCELLEWTLGRFGYRRLGRADKGVVRRFLMRFTGLSEAQLDRRVRQFLDTGRVRDLRGRNSGRPFERVYTRADIVLLAEADRLCGRMSGKAMAHVLRRQSDVFGEAAFGRLAGISPSHIYNLRRSRTYRSKRTTLEKTRPSASAIGERRPPEPRGEPGHVRVDTVHQGDLDGVKGVYLVNLVDCETQHQYIGAVPAISENHMVPVLEGLLSMFPFVIKGFHSDNGSEYVNRRVASMLAKLDAEFTRSRPRRSNDNALAEGKNAHTVRRHLGRLHIPTGLAGAVHAFTRDVLSPFLNFHRPCLFPRLCADAKGKVRRTYPRELVATPHEALKRLPGAGRFLKPGVTFEALDALALAESDLQAAKRVAAARDELFRHVFKGRAA